MNVTAQEVWTAVNLLLVWLALWLPWSAYGLAVVFTVGVLRRRQWWGVLLIVLAVVLTLMVGVASAVLRPAPYS